MYTSCEDSEKPWIQKIEQEHLVYNTNWVVRGRRTCQATLSGAVITRSVSRHICKSSISCTETVMKMNKSKWDDESKQFQGAMWNANEDKLSSGLSRWCLWTDADRHDGTSSNVVNKNVSVLAHSAGGVKGSHWRWVLNFNVSPPMDTFTLGTPTKLAPCKQTCAKWNTLWI